MHEWKKSNNLYKMTTGILTTVAISCLNLSKVENVVDANKQNKKKKTIRSRQNSKIKFALITLKFSIRSFSLRALSSQFSWKTSFKSPLSTAQILTTGSNISSTPKCNFTWESLQFAVGMSAAEGLLLNKMHHSISFQVNKAIYVLDTASNDDLHSEIQTH